MRKYILQSSQIFLTWELKKKKSLSRFGYQRVTIQLQAAVDFIVIIIFFSFVN